MESASSIIQGSDPSTVCGDYVVIKSPDGYAQEIHQRIPDGIEVKRNQYGYGLYATKFFPEGSTLYIGIQLIMPNEYAEFKLVVISSDDTSN